MLFDAISWGSPIMVVIKFQSLLTVVLQVHSQHEPIANPINRLTVSSSSTGVPCLELGPCARWCPSGGGTLCGTGAPAQDKAYQRLTDTLASHRVLQQPDPKHHWTGLQQPAGQPRQLQSV